MPNTCTHWVAPFILIEVLFCSTFFKPQQEILFNLSDCVFQSCQHSSDDSFKRSLDDVKAFLNWGHFVIILIFSLWSVLWDCNFIVEKPDITFPTFATLLDLWHKYWLHVASRDYNFRFCDYTTGINLIKAASGPKQGAEEKALHHGKIWDFIQKRTDGGDKAEE